MTLSTAPRILNVDDTEVARYTKSRVLRHAGYEVVEAVTGHDALPYLGDGPIADAETFAELNRVMGDQWPMFALWFN